MWPLAAQCELSWKGCQGGVSSGWHAQVSSVLLRYGWLVKAALVRFGRTSFVAFGQAQLCSVPVGPSCPGLLYQVQFWCCEDGYDLVG